VAPSARTVLCRSVLRVQTHCGPASRLFLVKSSVTRTAVGLNLMETELSDSLHTSCLIICISVSAALTLIACSGVAQ